MRIDAEEIKNLCCLCCQEGPLAVNINMAKRGYVPGEEVVFNARLTNFTNRSIIQTRARLVQVIFNI